MLKKISLILLVIITVISCRSIKELDSKIYVRSYNLDINTIDNINFKDKVNLNNNEINLYHINSLNIQGIPKIKLDINYEKATIDSFVINKSNNGVLLLELHPISNLKTVKKEILLARIPKNTDIRFELVEPNKIIDNTIFKIEKVDRDQYSFIMLKPYFLDEDTFITKEKQGYEKEVNLAEYNENMLIEYAKKKVNKDFTYNSYEVDIIKGKNISGNGVPNAEVEIQYENKSISTIIDDKGKWELPISEAYKGKIKLIQKVKVKDKIIETVNILEE